MIREVSFDSLKDLTSESSNPFTKYISYIDNDIVCGFIEYNDIYNTIDIVNVYVKEEFRNKKVATKLLRFLIENNKDKNNITLEVNSLNEIAIKLYKNFGFKIVAERRGYYKGIDGYLMELVL